MKIILFSISALLFSVIFYYWLASDSFTPKNSQYFHNGTIITMENNFPIAEAVFIEDGRISALGSEEEMRRLIDEDTEIIDLIGKTLLPGFIDSHTHPVVSAFTHGMIDLSGFSFQTNEEIWRHLESKILSYDSGEWILCKGLDVVLVPDLESPHISYLDSISPYNPLLIASLSMHSYWANSLAFKKAGVSKITADPGEASYYGKDDSGELTGYISEQSAFNPFKKTILADLGQQVLQEKMATVLAEYTANGNTTITSLGITTSDPNVIRLYDHLSGEKSSFLNRFLAGIGLLPKRKPTVRHFIYLRGDAAQLLPSDIENGDDFFKIVGIKFWYDGSPYTGTMFLNEPYLNSQVNRKKIHLPADHSGRALLDSAVFIAQIRKYDTGGWQLAVHTQGDRAITETLNAFAAAGADSAKDSRHRLEHCLLPLKGALQKMSVLGIHPSFHINHLYYYGEALEKHIIGRERTEQILPLHEAETYGLRYSLHADQPMFESDPLSLLHTAVNRSSRDGKIIGSHNKINVEQGLKALTINAAWQLKMEDEIGSIKVGKYADFVILDKNPLTIETDKIREIKVLQTIVNGNTVYKNR